MRRWTLGAATVLAATTLVVSGCAAGGGGNGGDGNVTLTMWVLNETETVNQGFEDLAERFHEENPDITVEVEFRDGDAHKEAMRQAAGTPSAPDIFRYWTGLGLGGQLIDAGASLDLTKYYEEYDWPSRFSEANLAEVTKFGGYQGIPFGSRAEAIFYDKAKFEEAGITAEPTTYDEFVAAAQKLKDAGIPPITFGGTVNWHLERLTDSLLETACGSETNDALVQGDVAWTDEDCVVDAFSDLADWGENYIQSGFAGTDYDTASSAFLKGETAMAFEGDWYNTTMKDNGLDPDDYGLFGFPTGTGRMFGLSDAMYISANSKHPDEAAKFLDFITSDKEQEAELGVFTPIPINKNVAPAADLPDLDKWWFTYFDEATGLYSNNDTNMPPARATEWQRIQNLVAAGELAPEDAPAEFQKFIDNE
jgi:raffinose/stachyose/melibiose transport system substrate-binding protein